MASVWVRLTQYNDDFHPSGKRWVRWAVDHQCVLDDLAERVLPEAGRPVRSWPKSVRLECDTPKHAEDFPFPISHVWYIVSDRVRTTIEREAPGQVEFLPVEMRRRKQKLKLPPYWVMNVLNRLAVQDVQRSIAYNMKPPPVYKTFAISLSAVPEHIQLFLLEDAPVWSVMMRRRLVEALEAQHMTGLNYFETIDAP